MSLLRHQLMLAKKQEMDIMQSLVLWYDPRRQGATNESMAADPRLIDLSGNGHDAECRNFAWGGMSGIGGYTDNLFDSGNHVIFPEATLLSSDTVEIRGSYYNSPLGIGYWSTASMTPRLILEVSGLIDDQGLKAYQYNTKNDISSAVVLHNGVNDVQLKFNESYPQFATVGLTKRLSGNKVTVRILPLYPGALVLDGVDDKCETESIELLSDFTIVTERECINQSNGASFANAQKAFIFERNNSGMDGPIIQRCVSYGKESNVVSAVVTGRSVSWMTPTSYKGSVALTRGTDEAAAGKLTIGNTYDYGNRYGAWALWSFLLFRRTLTEQEIEWVKEHLMGEPKTEL